MKLCGVTKMSDGKKRMRAMNLCCTTALLYDIKLNEYSEALRCHIVEWEGKNDDNEALWSHSVVVWEEME